MTKKENEPEKLIEQALEFILKTKKSQLQRKEFKNVDALVELGIAKLINKELELYEFETNAPLLTKALYGLFVQKMGQLPIDIPNAFQKLDEFEEVLKKEQGIAPNVIGSYSTFLRGLKGYVLFQLEQKGVDVGSFFEGLMKNKGQRENQLFLFEDSFFRFLPNSGYPAPRIFALCKLAMENDEAYYVLDFARSLPYKNKELAQELYELSKGHKLAKVKGFVTNLAVGLYNSGKVELFEHYRTLIAERPNEAFRFFQVIQKKNQKTLEAILGIVASNESEENRVRKTDVLCDLINHPKATKKLRKQSFDLIKSYFESQEENVVHGVLWSSTYIKDFEEERFRILMAYLQKTSNFKALTNFFRRFKDPRYMFALLRECYYLAWGRTSIEFFKEAIVHFWQENKEASEKQILEMFEPERQLGLLPVEVLMSGYMNPLPVDLMKLESEAKQVNAIRCICAFPHSFDSLLPIVLKLKDSKYPKVKAYLKERLSLLIVEVYHELLYKSIKELLGASAKDKKFLKEMSTALDRYKKIKELKESVNDLNPRQNERNFMELFYSLEHERRSKLMEDINQREGSFLSHAKRSVIVRGNAWKLPEKEEITPLRRFAAGHWMHGNAVLNPDLFELELRNM
ncbi:hypothetical protein [Flagellimonas zhangzhouensis]|uniref:Uncharacterized protein n=1 Tax=Flagellimonas zhangzhouensis TaxID=1073328 RepID=A0A1H2XP33_9FLAO|nr:hypothetical protein [Allomuricauda zhangzhouensis]SDQ89813.1 hypothetical protein SAMN05216294_2763 [Allomuricauda zhangzhouensis]SDW94692.1 hypothetical protein SAMN04487892_2757 [Allomuricauda zhangzhouensis]